MPVQKWLFHMQVSVLVVLLVIAVLSKCCVVFASIKCWLFPQLNTPVLFLFSFHPPGVMSAGLTCDFVVTFKPMVSLAMRKCL